MRLKQNKRGAAMIAALCILAIFLTLCLSMLLTASVLLHNATARLYEEQCKISALTLSEELERDIEDEASGFYAFLTSNIRITGVSPWPYLNNSELNHGERTHGVVRAFDVGGENESGVGRMTARMYWEFESGGAVSDVFLFVEVTAEKNGSKHTIVSVYNPSVSEDGSAWNWSLSERS